MIGSFDTNPAKPIDVNGIPTALSASAPAIIVQKGDWQLLSEPTHRAHVLLVMHRGDHRAAAKE